MILYNHGPNRSLSCQAWDLGRREWCQSWVRHSSWCYIGTARVTRNASFTCNCEESIMLARKSWNKGKNRGSPVSGKEVLELFVLHDIEQVFKVLGDHGKGTLVIDISRLVMTAMTRSH